MKILPNPKVDNVDRSTESKDALNHTLETVENKNKQPPKKKISENREVINVVIPTTKRNKVGFDYLKQTLEGLRTSFESQDIEYKINTFSTVPLPFEFKNLKHHVFIKRGYPPRYRPVIMTSRDAQILRQSIDWVEMMTQWMKYCPPNGIYMYMEDDFLICPDATHQIFSLFHWMKKTEEVASIKFGFGLNGIIMRCQDIPKILEYSKRRCFISGQTPYPVDWAVGEAYTSYKPHNDGKVSYTYRYNLLKHIGRVSTVGNDDVAHRAEAACYGPMYHQSIFYEEKFDIWKCSEFMFSPCTFSNKYDHSKDYSYRNPKEMLIDFPFVEKFREEMMSQMNVKDYIGKDSCDNICREKDMKCSLSHFPFVNNCDFMKKKFDNCDCEFTDSPVAPYFHNKICFIKRKQPFNCQKSNKSNVRICACQ